MRAVLYTHDLMPITVMKLQPWMVKFLSETGSFYLAVMPPVRSYAFDPYGPGEEKINISKVRITAELLRKGRHETFMLFTEDEESALLIQAAFLPGQQRTMNDIREEEFAKGFFAALR